MFSRVSGGAAWLPLAVNSCVHGLMHTYYLLASLGPRLQPLLWWKPYLLKLQILQFAGIACYSVLLQVISTLHEARRLSNVVSIPKDRVQSTGHVKRSDKILP